MKKVLTTTLILAIVMSMLCIAPTVNAEDVTVSQIKVHPVIVPVGEDKFEFEITNLSDKTWVVVTVTAKEVSVGSFYSVGDHIYIEQKTAEAASSTNCQMRMASALLDTVEKFEVVANVTDNNGLVSVLDPQEFTYTSFEDMQVAARTMLLGTTQAAIDTAKAVLPITYPSVYEENDTYAAAVLATLRTKFATLLANTGFDFELGSAGTTNPSDETTHIPMTGAGSLFEEFEKAALLQAINSGSVDKITEVIANYSAAVGIDAIATEEKAWFAASSNQAAVKAKLAAKTYTSFERFARQFATECFLDKLPTLAATNDGGDDIISVLRAGADKYYEFNADVKTTLNFGVYDTRLNPTTDEWSRSQLVGNAFENLTALQEKFNEVLMGMVQIEGPTTDQGDSYTGPTTGPTISVGTTTGPVTGGAKKFLDLETVPWAKMEIEALAAEGVIDGVTANMYAPDANVTREQFVKIIVNAFGLKGTGKMAQFADVDSKEWYSPYINVAVELGIVNGKNAEEFGIGENITRQDMTVIMYRVGKYVNKQLAPVSNREFSDKSSLPEYAVEAAQTLYKAGIINGVADGVFGGAELATRAQAAKLAYTLRNAY